MQERGAVIENVRLARDTFRVRIAAPRIAASIVPGQFVMLRLAGYDDPLLGRPLALYDTVVAPDQAGSPFALDVVYLVQGKLTSRLARFQAGQQLELWGPLGNGFSPSNREHLIMVAGGIGQTPFLALAQEALRKRRYGIESRAPGNWPRRVTLCYGARTAEYLAGVEDFRRLGVEVLISTDDGTAGHHGLVTDLLERVLGTAPDSPNSFQIVTCGPEPMMAAVARLAAARSVPCEVSLETPMACGVGICFSCVTRVKDEAAPSGWDYRRTCVEGPVFDAARIEW
jgi:dihydroorotate dehydrogenase electron transfer subunit